MANAFDALEWSGGGAAEMPSRGIGKISSYGYADDPYGDSASLGRGKYPVPTGAFDNELRGTSIAVSPDIQSSFRQAGIKPGDPVELTLADGRKVIRTYDDHTMQDKEAIAKYGKPFRERFDFYTPEGPLREDGAAVVQFAKAEPEVRRVSTGDTPTGGRIAVGPMVSLDEGLPLDAPETAANPFDALQWNDAGGGETQAATNPFDALDWQNPLQPMPREAFIAQYKEKANKPFLTELDEAATGIGQGISGLAETGQKAFGELTSGQLGRIPASLQEGAARGTFDFVDLVRRLGNSDRVKLATALLYPGTDVEHGVPRAVLRQMGAVPEEDILDREYAKYLQNWAWEQERQRGGDTRGNIAVKRFGEPLPNLAEASSLVLDPTMVVPLAGQTTKLANVGRRLLMGAAKPVAKAAEVGGGAVARAATRAIEATGGALERAGVDPAVAKMVAGGAAGAAGVGSLTNTPGRVALGAIAGGKGAEFAGKAAGAVAEAFPVQSQLRMSERIARDASKPAWLRRMANTMSKVPERITGTAGAALEGAIQGSVVGGGLAYLSEQDAGGIGRGIGSGGLLGTAGGAIGYNLPAANKARMRFREAGDIMWMHERQAELGGAVNRLNRLSPEDSLRIATLQRIMDTSTDLVFLDKGNFARQSGGRAAAGIHIQMGETGRPRILVNLDAGISPVQILAHELYHDLAAGPAINKDAARLAISQVYSPDTLHAMGREYARRQLEAEMAQRPPMLPEQPPPLPGPAIRPGLAAELGLPIEAPAVPMRPARVDPRKIEAQMVTDRFNELREASIARGDRDGFDWIRDEVLAEHLAADLSGKDWGINALRQKLPDDGSRSRFSEWTLDTKAKLLGAFGVKFGPAGELAVQPSALFRDNPLSRDPALQRLTRGFMRDRFNWLRGLTKEEAPDTPRGAPLLGGRKLESLANSPAVEWRQVAPGLWENDFATRDGDGRVVFKDPKAIAAIEKARHDAIGALIPRERLPVGDRTLGRKIVDGKEVIAGDSLPALWDLNPAFSQETKQAARAMENARKAGDTFSIWYHQIGSGRDGSWAQAVRSRLGNVAATNRELSLVNWEVTRANNIIGNMLDVGAARARALELQEAGRLGHWGGDVNAFQGDVMTYLANHAAGLPGETAIGTSKRDFINGFFGVASKANRRANPLQSGQFGISLIKSFRLDRMQNVQPTGRSGWSVDYPRIRENLMPAPQ
ncbi:MAG TPA: hypothetical protein VGP99_00150 [Tepidisphaeraceae bacterium]|nr:hypothetical protein [Tepidisphaeraceae bacterium]